MTISVYGLKNCDSCKKTMKYLGSCNVDAELLDVRENPPTAGQLKKWCSAFGRDAFVNRRSTTWRSLSDEQKNIATDAQAIELVTNAPALMKRPVLVKGVNIMLGSKPTDIDNFLK